MTLTVLVTIALAAAPIVLLLTTAGCATIAGIELPPILRGVGPYNESVKSSHALIGYWRLDESESVLDSDKDKHVTDYSSNHLNGKYFGDRNNIALEQQGALKMDNNGAALFTGGHVEVPFDVALTPPTITIELWLKVESAKDNPHWRDVVACYVPDPSDDSKITKGYRVRACTYSDNGRPALGIECALAGADQVYKMNTWIDDPQVWHHIAFSCVNAIGPDGVCVSLDGQAKPYAQTKKYDHLQLTSADGQNLRFAVNPPSGPATFTGLLDEIAIYNDAFSTDWMQKQYELGSTGTIKT